jgi:uncharacterized protein
MDGKHLPGRHPIEKFGNGGFSFGGMSHRGSLLILPSGMRALPASVIEGVTNTLLRELADEKELIDFLLIGTGVAMKRIPKSLADWFSTQAIHHDTMSTSAAVSTYNVLLAEERRVAAILIAVE